MNTPKKPPKCKFCSSPGDHQGWMYEMLPKNEREKLVRSAVAKSRGGAKRLPNGFLGGIFKRLDLPMCGQHYLQYMLNCSRIDAPLNARGHASAAIATR